MGFYRAFAEALSLLRLMAWWIGRVLSHTHVGGG